MCYGMNCGYEGSNGTCGSYSRPEEYPCHNGFHEPEVRKFNYSDIKYWETLVIEAREPKKYKRCIEYTGQFVSEVIERTSLPKGKYLYEIRHDENDDEHPCKIEDEVDSNFYGSFISNVPLPLPSHYGNNLDFNYLEIKDWWYE